MFNRLLKKNTTLLTSSLHDEHSFYGAFSRDLRSANKRVLIESPFITIRRATEISPILKQVTRSGVEVVIFTRNPYHHDGILVHEASSGIELLRQSGAKVVTCDDMRHRKLAVIDNHILWEGSLNMLSQNGSKEIMRRVVSKELCQQMLRFIEVK
jgi:phosphatidylserine/phosphatidylglycerophosphate/cardiolipin synthase-like enzyme